MKGRKNKLERIICIIIGYIFGLFETGYLYGKLKNTDIRNHGSGNAGTTNALRTFGFKGGLITFAGDFLKSILAALFVGLIFGSQPAEYVKILQVYAGFGAVLGHDFPIYLNFKGGKGIATTAGLMIIINTKMALIAMAVFIIIALSTRFVSLASLIAISTMFAGILVCGNLGFLPVGGNLLYEIYGVTGVLTILAFVKHKSNISRLLNGTENKLSFKKK